MADTDLETRVKKLEQLVERAIVTARRSPIGRKILSSMGLE